MKKNYFYLAAAASIVLTSCSDTQYVGPSDEEIAASNEKYPITIGSFSNGNSTRANFYGTQAAEKLGGQFYVFGAKTVNGVSQTVFKNYTVKYEEGSEGTTESNTKGWEYVGFANLDGDVASQTIKYWDYNASQYDFQAFVNASASTDNNIVSTVNADGTATIKVTVKNADELTNLFIADKETIKKPTAVTTTGGQNVYGGVVTFTFRAFGTKIRLGLYETIPGYSVSNVTFRYADVFEGPAQAGRSAVLKGYNYSAGTYTVTYNVAEGNRPVTTFEPSANGFTRKINFGNFPNTTIGEGANNVTYANGGQYVNVFPNEDKPCDMTIYVDYTLTSDDGSGETIRVTGAHATVPAAYMTWKPNFAYTYLFKLSAKTNGTTGVEDPNTPGKDPKPVDPDYPGVDPTDPSDPGTPTDKPDPDDPDDPNKPTNPNDPSEPTNPEDPNNPGTPEDPTNPVNPQDPTDPTPDPETPDVTGLYVITFDAIVSETEDGYQETITNVAETSITTYHTFSDATLHAQFQNEFKAGEDLYVSVFENGTATLDAGKATIYTLSTKTFEAQKYTDAQAKAYNRTLPGALKEDDDLTDEQATAINILKGVNEYDEADAVNEADADLFNSTLPGAKTVDDIRIPAVTGSGVFTESALAKNLIEKTAYTTGVSYETEVPAVDGKMLSVSAVKVAAPAAGVYAVQYTPNKATKMLVAVEKTALDASKSVYCYVPTFAKESFPVAGATDYYKADKTKYSEAEVAALAAGAEVYVYKETMTCTEYAFGEQPSNLTNYYQEQEVIVPVYKIFIVK